MGRRKNKRKRNNKPQSQSVKTQTDFKSNSYKEAYKKIKKIKMEAIQTNDSLSATKTDKVNTEKGTSLIEEEVADQDGLKKIQGNHTFRHFRNKDTFYTVCIIVQMNELKIGYSRKRNTDPQNFSKKLGRIISKGRAMKNCDQDFTQYITDPSEIDANKLKSIVWNYTKDVQDASRKIDSFFEEHEDDVKAIRSIIQYEILLEKTKKNIEKLKSTMGIKRVTSELNLDVDVNNE